VVAFIAIKDQKTIGTIRSIDRIPIKVFYLLEACLVISLAIFRYCNSLIAREVAFLILTREIILARNNNERR
jgi:hypothetical protein